MNQLINFILIISIINEIFLQETLLTPEFGECGKIGYTAKNYESCSGKKPVDESNYYCCFLKSGKKQECVEILKKDIDDDAVKVTILEIEKGIYEPWNNNNGYNLNKIYGKLSELQCDKSFVIQFNIVILFLSLIFTI